MYGTQTWFNGNESVAGKMFIYLLQSDVVTTEKSVYGSSSRLVTNSHIPNIYKAQLIYSDTGMTR